MFGWGSFLGVVATTLNYKNIIVSNFLFLKLLKVKVGFSEKYAYFMAKSAGILSGRPQKLEAVL